jgi:hypothetical protein
VAHHRERKFQFLQPNIRFDYPGIDFDMVEGDPMRWLCLILLCGRLVAQNTIAFSFTTTGPADTATSAAVYDSTGTMVRWLWGGVMLAPGTYQRMWDGNLQNGTPATAGATYTIKLLENQVVYTFDGGFIGDTEKGLAVQDRYAAYGWQITLNGSATPTFAFAGNRGWFAGGYNEGGINLGWFDDMNKPRNANFNYMQNHIMLMDIATDGSWVYFMNTGAFSPDISWITAINAVSGSPVYFTSGTYLSGLAIPGWPKGFAATPVQTWPNTTINYIDPGPAWTTGAPPAGGPTGIAVQRSGNILAVAHGANSIKLWDKNAGTSLGTITTIANPTWMAFNSEGLWVVSSGGLYEVTGVGSSNTVTPITTLGGITFSNVVSVGSNGATNSIFVLDGGTNQQMYEFAVSSHTLMRTYGSLGGYSNCDPTISNSKLLLDQQYTTGTTTPYRSWVRVADSDDVWIADGMANRVLHISPANQYVDRLLYIKPNYSVAVSHGQPNRVFRGTYEYDMDYTQPLQLGDPDPALGGNGSWTLAKNWAVCAPSGFQTTGNGNPAAVEQLSNGRTYAMFWQSGLLTGMAEMPASGPLRKVATVPASIRANLLRNGHLSSGSGTSGTAPNYTVSITDYPLTGFNGSNDPVWGASTTPASMTTNSGNSYLTVDGTGAYFNTVEGTTDGVYTIFHNAPYGVMNQPHMGAYKGTGGSFYWQTMPERALTYPDYQGGYANIPGAAGNGIFPPSLVEGKNIIATYDGQGATWGNQYYHYWSDGLMVGQFGQKNTSPGVTTSGPTPFVIGTWGFGYNDIGTNIRAVATTQYNGDIYLYHGSEGGYGGILRWHLSNLASIQEWAGTGVLQVGGNVIMSPVTP